MKIKWLGHASFLITTAKGVRIVLDPYTPGGPLKYGRINETADAVTVSHEHGDHSDASSIKGSPQVFKGAGVYTVKGVEVKGIAAYHDTSRGSEKGTNTMFRFSADGITVAHMGDLGHLLSDKDLAELGTVDVLLLPVGGFYTIDAAAATKLVAQVKPKVAIPMHVKNEKCEYPLATVEDFLKGKTNVKRLDSSEIELKKEALPKATEIVVLQHAM
ncbi:MAG: MBL fold metallo-hydrolase [Dehalococcoidia bacterium]|nr:MBL fold metallo-hydrolase [Dehalococcoidia bacterium]